MIPVPASLFRLVQIPESPLNVLLEVNTGYSDNTLIYFGPPSSNGGSGITRYRVAIDPTQSLAESRFLSDRWLLFVILYGHKKELGQIYHLISNIGKR